MPKPINLRSLLQAKDTLKNTSFDAMLKYYDIELKQAEIEDIRSLTISLTAAGCALSELGMFFLGFKIPQIGKEFDLLRFGENCIINIELKSESTADKIKKQLLRNQYYLSFLKIEVFALTYISSTKEFHTLNANGELETTNISNILSFLREQKYWRLDSIAELFNPSDYLISPFNSTKQFLAGEYFLNSNRRLSRAG